MSSHAALGVVRAGVAVLKGKLASNVNCIGSISVDGGIQVLVSESTAYPQAKSMSESI